MLDEFKPIYPNEERLWQLFLRVQDAAPPALCPRGFSPGGSEAKDLPLDLEDENIHLNGRGS